MGRGRGGGRRFRRGRSLDLAFGLAFGLGIGIGVGVGVGVSAGLGRCRYRYRYRNLWRGRRRLGLRRSRAGGRRHRGQAPPPPGRRLLGLPGSSHHHSPPAVAGRFDRKVAGGDRASARAIQACWIDVLVGAGAPPAPLHLFFTPERGRGEGGGGRRQIGGAGWALGVNRGQSWGGIRRGEHRVCGGSGMASRYLWYPEKVRTSQNCQTCQRSKILCQNTQIRLI